MITIQDVKVKIRLLNSKTILAQVTLILFDIWEEHGWKVLRSKRIHPIFQEKIWIQAPSYKQQNKDGKLEWRETVYINKRSLYDQVLEKIYDAYCMAQSKKMGQDSVEKAQEEKINYDEIPV